MRACMGTHKNDTGGINDSKGSQVMRADMVIATYEDSYYKDAWKA